MHVVKTMLSDSIALIGLTMSLCTGHLTTAPSPTFWSRPPGQSASINVPLFVTVLHPNTNTTDPPSYKRQNKRMRIFTLASAVLAAASLAHAEPKTANIYIQPFDSSSLPVPVAEVTYDTSAPDAAAAVSASVTYYDAPALPASASLVRVGIYDTKVDRWAGSVSLTSAGNLGEGYAPRFSLSVDAAGEGEVLGVSLRGVKVDAGQAGESNVGPQANVHLVGRGKQPELNKPIVLSPEGKTVEAEEKTFLQKYVDSLVLSLVPPRGIAVMRTLYADLCPKVLVDDRYRAAIGHGRWRRGWQIELDDGSMRLQQCSTHLPFKSKTEQE